MQILHIYFARSFLFLGITLDSEEKDAEIYCKRIDVRAVIPMQEIRHSNKILLFIFLKSNKRVKGKEDTSYHLIFPLYRNNLKCWSM